ncbi:hypothetical protein TI04_11690 [Achromatium sp. WMS2]|nr:hypothetical protein TI04_11690 [Achromatium sp. WMS2]
MAPSDESECRLLLQTAYEYPGPALVRYPRGCGPGALINGELHTVPIGKAEIRRYGKGVAFLVFGSLLTTALEVAKTFDATVINMRFVKPLDRSLLKDLATSYHLLVTLEENVIAGGAGSAVNEFLAASGLPMHILNLGLPDHFIEHASSKEQLAEAGLDASSIETTVRQALTKIMLTL